MARMMLEPAQCTHLFMNLSNEMQVCCVLLTILGGQKGPWQSYASALTTLVDGAKIGRIARPARLHTDYTCVPLHVPVQPMVNQKQFGGKWPTRMTLLLPPSPLLLLLWFPAQLVLPASCSAAVRQRVQACH